MRGQPLPGDWLLTCRPGAERDLLDELALIRQRPTDATPAGPALVRARLAPCTPDGSLDLTFARQGFRIARPLTGDLAAMAAQAATALLPTLAAETAWSLTAWVPDHDATNPLGPQASALERLCLAHLAELAPAATARCVDPGELPRTDGQLLQLALTSPTTGWAGWVGAGEALSLAPGGRDRMRATRDRPSRAARKVQEALSWLGIAPGRGEVCADLGAAPGGWSWVLLGLGARVVAVDPANLSPELASHRGLTHVQRSAFEFAPEDELDWLFCDMAWRPLEVAQLLAKWGRRRWARLLVANLKLPMKRKAETVEELREVVTAGGWKRVRTRQLYHDRDECTMIAHL
ncbi:MAG: SAM-dependent methyltransferase [Myxococcota bacterium]|nr:SAM-dependent methyltransferase [Myxococcota bacterium]